MTVTISPLRTTFLTERKGCSGLTVLPETRASLPARSGDVIDPLAGSEDRRAIKRAVTGQTDGADKGGKGGGFTQIQGGRGTGAVKQGDDALIGGIGLLNHLFHQAQYSGRLQGRGLLQLFFIIFAAAQSQVSAGVSSTKTHTTIVARGAKDPEKVWSC